MAGRLGSLCKPGVTGVAVVIARLPCSLGASPLQAGVHPAAGSGRGQASGLKPPEWEPGHPPSRLTRLQRLRHGFVKLI